jgi:hypothetical protein
MDETIATITWKNETHTFFHNYSLRLEFQETYPVPIAA